MSEVEKEGLKKNLFWLYSEAKEMYEEHLQKSGNKSILEDAKEPIQIKETTAQAQATASLKTFLRI
ncbi:MAG: hypothetical protein M1168_02035 [Candidatus Marsarchaeota archaeon]|nr:hypothetical protein [Candidatus Marsarchaeota archaeon]MCL5094740.1 hypothetical protein [Candidatus Marsarchaeota archaeon]